MAAIGSTMEWKELILGRRRKTTREREEGKKEKIEKIERKSETETEEMGKVTTSLQ